MAIFESVVIRHIALYQIRCRLSLMISTGIASQIRVWFFSIQFSSSFPEWSSIFPSFSIHSLSQLCCVVDAWTGESKVIQITIQSFVSVAVKLRGE